MLTDFIDRVRLPFRKEKTLYSDLQHIIGFYPRDISYYKQALLHKSMFHRNEKGKPVNNERLEFLGDAILDAAVGHIVYNHFPGKREGFLTNTRSKLVSRETLGKLADELGLTRLIMSNGRGQTHNSYIGGNAFEALVGAIYLDRGYNACMRFLEKRILKRVINIDKVAYKEVNFKSKLLEWAQKNRVNIDFRMDPQTNDEKGSPMFKCIVVIEGVEGGTGTGYSKKESQQNASRITLNQLRKKPQYVEKVFAAKTDRTKMEEEPTMAVPSTEPDDNFFVVHDIPDEATLIGNSAQNGGEAAAKPKPRKNRKGARSSADGGANGKNDAADAAEQAVDKATTHSSAGNNASADVASEAADLAEKPDEFDLSDISARPKSIEEIIEEAENSAYLDNAKE